MSPTSTYGFLYIFLGRALAMSLTDHMKKNGRWEVLLIITVIDTNAKCQQPYMYLIKATTGGLWPGFLPPVVALNILLPGHSSIWKLYKTNGTASPRSREKCKANLGGPLNLHWKPNQSHDDSERVQLLSQNRLPLTRLQESIWLLPIQWLGGSQVDWLGEVHL